jgi:hypothetical protein
MAVVPPSPYERFLAVNTNVRSDLVRNIELSTLPALVIWGTGTLSEGPPGTNASLSYIIELSAPAPAGGVRLDYRTVDGSAKAGSDYSATQGTLEIPEGKKVAYTESIDVFGDGEIEEDEDFYIQVSNVSGANPVSTTQRVTIAVRAPRMSDPLPPMEQ